MSKEKRAYRSIARDRQAAETKKRIVDSALSLFGSSGFEHVTIEQIAQSAEVSPATVYSLFKSKRGILHVAMDEAWPSDQFRQVVQQSVEETCPKKRLALSATIARHIYDAEHAQIALFRGVIALTPEFQEQEKERESRRYTRQEVTIRAMETEGSLASGVSPEKARDILWMFTGRDIYRMLVIERGWSSDEYESWLTESLIRSLIATPSSMPGGIEGNPIL